MVQKFSHQISECLQRAAETEQRAAQMDDPHLKASFSDIARRYRRLAESFEFMESLEALLREARVNFPRDEQPTATAVPPSVE